MSAARFDVGVSSIDDELIAVWGKKAGSVEEWQMLGARNEGVAGYVREAVQKLLKQNRVRRTPHEAPAPSVADHATCFGDGSPCGFFCRTSRRSRPDIATC